MSETLPAILSRYEVILSALGEKGKLSGNINSQIEALNKNGILFPKDLLMYYNKFGFVQDYHIDGAGNDIRIYGIENLYDKQLGYRFDDKSNLFDYWNTSWFVIADIGGDPIIANVGDSNQEYTPISIAFHGIGIWELDIIAPDIETFIKILISWVELFVFEYKKDIFNADFSPREDFLKVLKQKLSYLPDENIQNFIKYFIE